MLILDHRAFSGEDKRRISHHHEAISQRGSLSQSYNPLGHLPPRRTQHLIVVAGFYAFRYLIELAEACIFHWNTFEI